MWRLGAVSKAASRRRRWHSPRPAAWIGLCWSISPPRSCPRAKCAIIYFRGAQLPENVIVDAAGNPSRDPNDFYGPPTGALLPLGGPVGHKGYALGTMIEMLAGGLSGAGYVSEVAATHGNGVLFQVMHIAAFEDIDDFKRRTRELIAHVKSARPRDGVDEVLFPGEPEYRSTQLRSQRRD